MLRVILTQSCGAHLQVASYGVGGHVKLPGPTQKQPNVYEFGTPYEFIHNQLKDKDEALYTRNGLLKMLQRNMAVKTAPEKWQYSRCAVLQLPRVPPSAHACQ
eukprot:GHUV01041628.1.p3 GENE.GHUV01041628.1~~GHUV01041628.1.p3  ORF type:complete len:103 (-),score=26.85 GHUV01041628.1:321-629(-)